MPRTARAIEAGMIYHVLNRGNARMRLFHKDADFDAFERVLGEALERYPVDLLTYCLMGNHWHLVVRAKLVRRAEDWSWGGFHARRRRGKPFALGKWPVNRPRNWIGLVNAPLDEGQLDHLRTCVNRGRPCGDEAWTKRTATRLALLFTLRNAGRPRKQGRNQ